MYKAEAKYDDDKTYLVRKIRRMLKTEAKGESVRGLFEELDRNGDGTITALEFRRGLRDLGFNLDEREASNLIRHCDLNGNGEVSYREFQTFVSRSRDADVQEILDRLVDNLDGRALQETFADFDRDYSGEIDVEEMHEGLRQYGIALSVAEAEKVMDHFGGRRVRYRDFVAAMRGRPPASYPYQDSSGEKSASYAVRRLAEEVERCARNRHGDFDVRRVFHDMDVDGSGTLDRTEIRNALDKLGCHLTRSEIHDIMDFFGGQNEINIAQFTQFALRQDPSTLRLVDRVRREIQRISERNRGPPDYRGAFRELDADGSGTIDHREFRSAMSNLGLRLSSHETRQIMNMFDANGDDRISAREFIDFVRTYCDDDARAMPKY